MTNTIGPALVRLRKRRGLTQLDAAGALGMGRSTLAGIEAGVKPPGRIALEKLARFYQTTIDGLYAAGGTEPGQFVNDPDELALLSFWRGLCEPGRHLFLLALRQGQND